jgi:UDP-N-acetylmuramoyl-L-alanyl-D-glutamate--2,6-diaminopimelate ligase
MARLTDLLTALTEPTVAGWHGEDVLIAAVTADSRAVGPGVAFVATHHRGYARDGHTFVEDAVRRGASAIFVERPPSSPLKVPLVVVASTSTALAQLAAALAGWPASRLAVIGVTGTDGKTTTSSMAHEILVAAGRSPGLVATVATGVGASLSPNRAHVTTPDPVAIQGVLAATVAAGGTAAVLEATSHGLDQGRVDSIEFDVAVVTRVTHDHLDYHGTYEVYREAKAGLLDRLAPAPGRSKDSAVAAPKVAAILATDPAFSFLADRARCTGASVTAFVAGNSPRPDGADRMVRAVDLKQVSWGTVATVETPWGRGRLDVRIPGAFNVLNAIAAIAATGPLDVPLDVALSALEAVDSLPGRLNRIDEGQPYTVVVDFAHTADSLANVLREMRSRTSGRVIVVFGAAGERDRVKRPEMGRVAATHADFAILTDEDPRLEDRDAIIADIASGALAAGAIEGDHFVRVPDRREAVRAAIRRAQAGDIVVLAGKGHETSIDGAVAGRSTTTPWDEAAEAREALRLVGYAGASVR